MRFETAWPIASDLVTVLVTALIVLDTSLRFDRIAGRMAGGAVGVGVDSWLHGHAIMPVFLPKKKRAVGKKAVSDLVEEVAPPSRVAGVAAAEQP